MVLALHDADDQKYSRVSVQKDEVVTATRKIAFFDFDGTITTKDTLLEIIKFQKGAIAFYTGFMLHSPWLVAYKAGLLRNDLAKQKILRYFFRDMPLPEFQQRCDAFARLKLPGLLRPGALEEIESLKSRGFGIVLVSASAGNWIRGWAEPLGFEMISTTLEVKDGRLTGNIEGQNCHGEEKVRRIRNRWNLADFDEILAYGDSQGDKPMLALATRSFYKPFRNA
jgi:HAD superfamily hydrolase (TIGR01490 family)